MKSKFPKKTPIISDYQVLVIITLKANENENRFSQEE
jgi:hypothetical protein